MDKRTNLFKLKLIIVLYSGLLLFSCNENIIVSEKHEIPSKIWEINEALEYHFEIDEPNQLYNIYLILEIYEDFQTNNLHLKIKSTSPSGNSETDTVMYFVCDKTGRWLGEKTRDEIYNKFLYKKGIHFPEKGMYTIVFEHLMRENNLPKIKSAGLIIEKVKN